MLLQQTRSADFQTRSAVAAGIFCQHKAYQCTDGWARLGLAGISIPTKFVYKCI